MMKLSLFGCSIMVLTKTSNVFFEVKKEKKLAFLLKNRFQF